MLGTVLMLTQPAPVLHGLSGAHITKKSDVNVLPHAVCALITGTITGTMTAELTTMGTLLTMHQLLLLLSAETLLMSVLLTSALDGASTREPVERTATSALTVLVVVDFASTRSRFSVWNVEWGV